MKKFFYFRKDSTLASDDDVENGSNLVACDDLISIEATSDTTATMRFKPRMNAFSGGEAANADYITDSVLITFATNTAKEVMTAIVDKMNEPVSRDNGFIVLFDAVAASSDVSVTAVDPAIAAAQA